MHVVDEHDADPVVEYGLVGLVGLHGTRTVFAADVSVSADELCTRAAMDTGGFRSLD